MLVEFISSFIQIIPNDFKENNNLLSLISVFIIFIATLIYFYKHINDIFVSLRKSKIDNIEEIKKLYDDETLDDDFRKFLLLQSKSEMFKYLTKFKVDPYLVEHILKVYHYSKGEIRLYTFKMAKNYLKIENNKMTTNLNKCDKYINILFSMCSLVYFGYGILMIFFGNLYAIIVGLVMCVFGFLIARDIVIYLSAKKIKNYLEKHGDKIYNT